MQRRSRVGANPLPGHSGEACPPPRRGSGNPLPAALLLAAILVASSPASAQVITGLPPFGSFSGGPDIVNNANLNVHLQIPILTKAGRGLPLYYALTYESAVWYPSSASGTNAWTPTGDWGWGTVSQPEVGSVTYSWSQGLCTDLQGNGYYYDIYSNWVYYDSLGASHSINPNWKVSDQSVVAPNCHAKGPPYNQQAAVTDGSGYTLAISAAPAATVTTRSGTVIQPVIGSQSVSATDANGNQITYNGTSFTDTLGTTALTVSGIAPNPTTFTYTNPQDNTSHFTMNYVQKTVRTDFGCSGVAEFGPTSQYLVTSITLPDNTSYQFTYEETPGDTHNPHYVTGRIASITLPQGGTISYQYAGSNNGIVCTDGSTATLKRFTPDTGSNYWQYAHSESGTAWTTTITDPQNNQTVMNFQTIYETERQVAGLETVVTCYNNNPNPCTNSSNNTAVGLPITQQTVMTTVGSLTAETNTTYNEYGLPSEVDEYDYGPTLVRKTLTTYASLGNDIYDHPSTIQVENASGTVVAETDFY